MLLVLLFNHICIKDEQKMKLTVDNLRFEFIIYNYIHSIKEYNRETKRKVMKSAISLIRCDYIMHH